MYRKNIKYEILTPSGWQDFNGVRKKEKQTLFKMTFSDGNVIRATAEHKFFHNGVVLKVSDLKINQPVDTITGCVVLLDIHEEDGNFDVYDIIDCKDKNHQFLVDNSLITGNCDEFSFVNPRIAEEFWTSISPTLSTGGKCIITSTPNNPDDQFSKIWKDANKRFDEYGNERVVGKNGFRPFYADWRAHPDRDEAWANAELDKVGEEKFSREHENRFIVYDETLINAMTLDKLKGEDPMETMGQVRWYRKINPNRTYIVALDPSMGTGGDNAAIQVLEVPSMEQVAEWAHNKTPVEDQVRIMRDILSYIEKKGATDIYWSIESNNIGEAALVVIRDTGEDKFPGMMLNEPRDGSNRSRRKGFCTTHKTKIEACAKLKSFIESGKLKVNSKYFLSELRGFVRSGNSFEARNGDRDDLVSAMLLTIRMALIVARWDEGSFSKINSSLVKPKRGSSDYEDDEEDRLGDDEDDDYIAPMPFLL